LVAYANPFHHPCNAPLAMTDDNLMPFSFPAIRAKKVTAAFDGGRLTSDGGVMLLAVAERRHDVADRLARCFPDLAIRCAFVIRAPT
jgi:Transposase DDE domain group 1